jgi:hypothetical protein
MFMPISAPLLNQDQYRPPSFLTWLDVGFHFEKVDGVILSGKPFRECIGILKGDAVASYEIYRVSNTAPRLVLSQSDPMCQ